MLLAAPGNVNRPGLFPGARVTTWLGKGQEMRRKRTTEPVDLSEAELWERLERYLDDLCDWPRQRVPSTSAAARARRARAELEELYQRGQQLTLI